MHRLFTLGELRLESADGLILSRRRKPLILLAYLARRMPRAAARTELATLVWGERDEARARQSLRQALLELHRGLGQQLIVTNDAVRLETGALSLDANEFERDVAAGRNREALARWAADFLVGADDRADSALRTWVEGERAGLRRQLMLACERLIDDAEQRGANREALAVARRWTEFAPLDEHACRRLILALRHDGRAAEALATHSSFVTRMKEELEVAPSRAFIQLGRSIDESAQGARQLGGGVSPTSASQPPFVGREEAFAFLSAAWDSRACRPSTVAVVQADPGLGADRLCGEFAAACRDRPDGALVLGVAHDRSESRSGAPFDGARRALGGLSSSPALGGLSPDSLRVLAYLLPRIRERFNHLPAAGEPPSADELTAAAKEALDSAAEDGPVLVLLGRFAEMDSESRALFAQLAGSSRSGLVLILVIADDESERRAASDDFAGAHVAMGPPLRPLGAADVAALLDLATTLRPEDRDALAAMLYRDTGGLPRYLAPALDELQQERLLIPQQASSASVIARIGGRPLPIPERVRIAVRERMRALGETPTRLLEAGAVLGTAFSTHHLSRMLGADVTMAELDHLERLGWLRGTGSGAEWEVAPPMLQRTIRSLVPPLRRESLESTIPRSRLPRRFILAAALLLVVVVTAASVTIWKWRAPAVSAEHAVAVFPFAVSGGARIEFLRAGMVDLLSTSLDGAAGLHTLDPRVVLAATNAAGIRTPLTPRQAIDIARRLGASHLVLGTVVSAAGRLHVSAILYDVRRGDVPEARASAEGAEASLFDVVDRLTAQLAVNQGTASGERLTQLAAVTTSSLEALKAYLAGRSAYRANDLYLALSSYQRAVAADSTFALAWYGLASTASWMLRPDIERQAAAQAVRQGTRLSARDRSLIEAFYAYSRGSADSAERLARGVTGTYDDIEAWVLLGEVLYHHNWKRGRSLTESREAWQRVLALDSTYWPALQHLAEVYAVEGRAAEADSLLARYERSVGAAHMMLASRAMRAYAYRDSASLAAVAPQLRNDRGFWLTLSVWYVSVLGHDLEDGSALARHLVERTRPPAQQGFGHVLLAHLDLARGRWKAARAELALARPLTPVDALEYELLLGMAPFLPASPAELSRIRADLSRLPDAPTDNSMAMSWIHTQGMLRPLTRLYLIGMASARAGDERTRLAALASLAAAPDPTSTTAMGTGFALSIRAEHERMLHHPAAALAYLERGTRQTPFTPAWTSGFVSQAYERFVRAELLHELGRDDEALRWYATFGENSPYDLVYLAPSLYRQAQIYDARGEKALAASHYARFLALWSDSDPEFAPMTTNATTRLALQR